jgi:pilus assembly protein Flp/PilA
MLHKFAGFAADEKGATAIEYGLIAALIAVVCIGAFLNFGGASGGMYERVFIQTIGPALK